MQNMARKLKCPSCGAKNAADDRRCKICTAVLNPDAPEAASRAKKAAVKQQAAVQAAMVKRDEARQAQPPPVELPVEEEAIDDYIGPSYGERSGDETVKESAFNVPSLLGIDIGDVQSRHAGSPEPLPVDPTELDVNAVKGIDIDVMSRHPGTPDLPPETDDVVGAWDAVRGVDIDLVPKPGIADVVPQAAVAQEWDSVQGIEIDVQSRHPAEPPPPPATGNVVAEWDAVRGVEINSVSRHPGDPEPPPTETRDVVAEWDAVRGVEIQPKKKRPPREPL